MKIIWTLLLLASFSLQGICYDKVSTTVVAKSDETQTNKSRLKAANNAALSSETSKSLLTINLPANIRKAVGFLTA